MKRGQEIRCWLVGAGPGDPGLLTVRGMEILRFVDVVIYDSLVNESLLDLCAPGCEKLFAGKRAGSHTFPQEEIQQLMVDRLRAGKTVARLKGGDPFVFARGGEEIEAVDSAGFGFEVVPGVTAGTAAPAYAGIPLTHRAWASHVTFVTAHERSDKPSPVNWKALAGLDGTLVIYMGARSLQNWSKQLLEHGMEPTTPAAFIQWGTWTSQRSTFGTLATLPRRVEELGLGSPAIVVLGKSVSMREKLRWFEALPLFGQRIVVTRSRQQNQSLRLALRSLGGEVLEIPTLFIEPYPVEEALIEQILRCPVLAFSSGNGVEHFLEPFLARHDIRDLAGKKLATVGASTAAVLNKHHLKVDFVPSRYQAEVMGSEWPASLQGPVAFICGSRASTDFQEQMHRHGIEVRRFEVYRTREEVEPGLAAERIYRESGADWLTFCSSSAVRAFARHFGPPGPACRVAALGPVTAATLRSFDFQVDTQPEESSIAGLIHSLVRASIDRRSSEVNPKRDE